MLKVSSIKRLFNNRIYERNPQNANLDYLLFDGNERLVTRQKIYHINYNIIFRLNNGSSVYI